MKICITGTHSSGKTTLTNTLSQILNIPAKEEIARKLYMSSYNFDEVSQNLNKFLEFEEAVINEHLKENREGSFINDRCLLDTAVYIFERLNRENSNSTTLFKYYLFLLEKAKERLKEYDLIVMLKRSDFKGVDNTIRNLNPFHTVMIENLISNFLLENEKYFKKLIILDTMNFNERVDNVLKTIYNINTDNLNYDFWNRMLTTDVSNLGNIKLK